jgi:hypothetical protein
MDRFFCLCCLTLLTVGAVWATPLNANANISELEQMIRFPRHELLSPGTVLNRTLAQANADNDDVALVALLLLANTADEESGKVLQLAAADAKHPLHAGAAIYAQSMRETREMSADSAQSALTFALGRVSNQYARLFLAARLHLLFDESAMPALLADAREERDPVVQAYLLLFLAASNDPAILRATAALNWPTTISIPENLFTIMHAFNRAGLPLNPLNPCKLPLETINGELGNDYAKYFAKYLLDNWTSDWWNRLDRRQEEDITTVANEVDLVRMEDLLRRIDRQHFADTMRVCQFLTNNNSEKQFSDRAHVIGARVLHELLKPGNNLSLTNEIEAVECLTQFGPRLHWWKYTEEELAAERKIDAPLLLHAWQRLFTTIDPNYDMNQRITMQAELPPGTGIGTLDVAPEAIADPKLRAQYEENIKKLNKRIAKFNEQSMARKLQKGYVPMAEEYLVWLYSQLPDEREAFGKLLDTYGIEAKTKADMLQKAAANIEQRNK